MTDLAKSILDVIAAVRAEYAREATEWGYMRSPRRYLWTRAKDGWIPVRDLHDPQLSPAERQRFSRMIRAMIDVGVLEATHDGGGRKLEVRVPPPPKTRRAKP